MERHIDRIRVFKAMASPSYMAVTYTDDPVGHAFNMAKRAEIGILREPEFKDEFIEIRKKCKSFAVAVLNSCRTSSEVEMVLDDTNSSGKGKKIKLLDAKDSYAQGLQEVLSLSNVEFCINFLSKNS